MDARVENDKNSVKTYSKLNKQEKMKFIILEIK